jgi:hypothetical protein
VNRHAIANRAPARVITYVQPEPLPAHYLYSRAELAARRAEHRELYARWTERQLALAERDRKVRRFLLGFGAIVGSGVLAGLGLAVSRPCPVPAPSPSYRLPHRPMWRFTECLT